MTANPDFMDPSSTVLDALHFMHDHHFYTLFVCEHDGTVVGLVSVMDVIYGCGGSEDWRSIFANAMDSDDVSEMTMSVGGIDRMGRLEDQVMDKKVAKLQPKKPIISTTQDSVLSVARLLKSKRGAASLVVNKRG